MIRRVDGIEYRSMHHRESSRLRREAHASGVESPDCGLVPISNHVGASRAREADCDKQRRGYRSEMAAMDDLFDLEFQKHDCPPLGMSH